MADDALPGPRPSGPVSRRDLRASHEDRDRIVEILRVAGGDGRLTADELDDRVGAALTARTYGELEALVLDLPAMPGAAMPGTAMPGTGALVPGVPPAPAKELIRIDCGSGSTKRDGPWAVPQRMEVKVTSGSVILDFTRAQLTWPTLQIDADVHSGSLRLVTKPGIVLDTDDLAVRSGVVQVRAPWGDDVPATLRIDVAGKVGSGSIVARPPRRPRRSLWAWMLRRPRPPEPWQLPGGRNELPPAR